MKISVPEPTSVDTQTPPDVGRTDQSHIPTATETPLARRAGMKHLAEERALQLMSGVLQVSDTSIPQPRDVTCPVQRAFHLLGKNSGYAIPPQNFDPDATTSDRFEAICRSSGLRHRRIVLAARWWDGDHGDFIALAKDGSLVAVLRKGRHYQVFDETADRLVRFQPAMAEAWTDVGFVIYPPLAADIRSGWDIIKRLGSYCRADLMTLLYLSALVSVFALAIPVSIGFLTGTIIPSQDHMGLREFALILLVVAVAGFLLSVVAQLATIRVEGRAGIFVQAAAIDRILRLPATFFRKYSTGELVQRTLAITRLERLLTAGLMGGFLSGLFSLVSCVLMFFYAPSLALIPLGGGLLLICVSVWLGRAQVQADREQMRTSGFVSSTTFEMVTGVEKLRLAAAEAPVFERWAKAFLPFQIATLQQKSAHAWMNMSDAVISQLCVLGVFVYAGVFLDLEAFSIPHLIAFIGCLVAFLAGLRQLIDTAVHISTLKPIYDYASPIFREAPELDNLGRDPGTICGQVTLSNVRFAYHEDGPTILAGLNLEINAGEYVALVGSSGCGKSTVIRHLLGFETPQFGSVAIDGLDMRSIDKPALRRQIGIVMQSASLVPGTIYDNIVGANNAIKRQDVLDAIERVGLSDDLRDMPMGLQTTLSDATGGLSGGQIQRVLLAKAIVASPRILILDEATSALDNKTQSLVTRTLQELDATRIVVAHRLSTIIGADRIVVLDQGQVVEQGIYAELMDKQGHFFRMAQRQLA